MPPRASDRPGRRLRLTRAATGAAVALSLVAGPALAHADGFPSDSAKPDVVPLLSGFDGLWRSSGTNDLHGTVLDPGTLGRNDRLVSWINQHATPAQQFRALQDAEYDNTGTDYDQSETIADGLGSVLGPIYARGRDDGSLPKVSALINSQTGSAGAYVSTGTAKARFSYPRPYLPTDAGAQPVAGDDPACAPSKVNASSLAGLRTGASYADAAGNLEIARVPDATDTTHAFSPHDVKISGGYATAGICTGGAFPSGHTTTAYQAGITLATLVPELAPQILARTSEAGNDRIVLGVHYPLDIIGGRIDGEVALASRWNDAQFRTQVLEPARAELVAYLQQQCGGTIAACAARGSSYRDDPYGGAKVPGGTAQQVTDRTSALAVYQERLTYGFARIGDGDLGPSVPSSAQALLLSTFPTLTDAQRTSVLAQTQIASGFPLDQSGSADGSWQRLDLAAAMSATVQLAADGSVRVTATGGTPAVLPVATPPAGGATPPPAGGSTPAPAPARFAVTVATKRSARGVTASVRLNRALRNTATVRVSVTSGGRTVARATARVAAGARSVTVRVVPARGKLTRKALRVRTSLRAPGVSVVVTRTQR